LNNVERLPEGHRTPSGYNYRGLIGTEQLSFVKALLDLTPRERLVVVSMHIPLLAADGSDEPAGSTADCAELLALLSGRPHTLSLAGHTHTTEHHYLDGGHGFTGPGVHHHHVLTAACGSWWSGPYDEASQPLAISCDGTPKGMHVLSVNGSSYSTRYVAVGHSGHPQMRVALESVEPEGSASCSSNRTHRNATLTTAECGRTSISVNVFDGGPRTSIKCRIASRDPCSALSLSMSREVVVDVAAEMMFLRHRNVVKHWVEAAPCTHLWRAPLPLLKAGTYSALVDVVDQYGHRHSTSLIFEIVG
jgi:hypothetical protein